VVLALLFALFAATSTEENALDDLFGIFEEQERLDKISSASGRAVALREAPGSNWILDQSTLTTAPGLDLYDMLRTLPGMVPREFSLNHAEANMRLVTSMPDFSTLVVVDGRSMTSDASGAFFDRKLLSLRDIERVELVNGPASTLYGPNALLGVISVQRKKPRREGTRLTFALDGGVATGAPTSSKGPLELLPLGNAYLNLDQGWGSGGIRVSATGTYLPSFGYQNDSGLILREPGRKASGTVDLRQRLAAWELRAQVDAATKRSIYELGDGGITDQQDISGNLTLEREKLAGSDDRLLLNAWVRHAYFVLRPQLSGIALTPFTTHTTALELRAVYALATFHGNSLTLGTQTRLSLVDTSYTLLAPGGQWLLGFFAEDTYHPIQQLVLTAGIRLDITHRFTQGTLVTPSPRASIAWLINERHSLRIDYASALQNPQILDRIGTLVSRDGYPFVVGDPNIKPITIHNFSLAYLGRVGWAALRIEAYVAHVLNTISPFFTRYDSDVFATPDGRPLYQAPGGGRYKYPFYFSNLGPLWIPGALARIDLTPFESLRFFFNYTFVPVDQMHYAGAGVEFRYQRFVLSSQAYFHDQEAEDPTRVVDLPGRFFMNARAAYTFDPAGRVTLALTAMNLFDVRFFAHRFANKAANYGDANTGEHLGPRVWLTLEIRPFGN
jgi:outer membrane receptor for ferrienterochelin and colicin